MAVKGVLLAAAAAVAAAAVGAKLLSAPLKVLGRVAANTLLGLGALWAVNATAAVTGLQLGVNLFNAAVVGVLGIPGLGLLLLTRWVLGV